jgi:hypothetical protein
VKGAPKNADPIMLDDVEARPDFKKTDKTNTMLLRNLQVLFK